EVGDIGLDRARAHGGNRVELVALAKNVPPFLIGPRVLDEHVHLPQPLLVVAAGQANGGKGATAAEIPLIAIVDERPRDVYRSSHVVIIRGRAHRLFPFAGLRCRARPWGPHQAPPATVRTKAATAYARTAADPPIA